MKYLFLFILLLLNNVSIAQDAELKSLVQSRQYTELKRKLDNNDYNDRTQLIFSAIVYNVFNQPDRSRKAIETLLGSTQPMDDSTRHMLLETQHDNYVKLFDYAKALETKQELMGKYAGYIPKENVEDELQTLNIWKALKNIPKQTVEQNNDTTILQMARDFTGLQRIPIKKDNAVYSFILDTGAGLSTVTDSMAKVMHLKIIDHIPIMIKGGVTGLGTQVKLGIADSIYLGDIKVNNVLFLVFPDEAMTFKSEKITFKIAAIIGFPVIKETGSISFYEDRLVIAKTANEMSKEPNMAVDLLKPIIYLGYNGEDLPFTFDTGADESILSEVFYRRYKKMVDRKGRKKTAWYGGAGGVKGFNVKVLPSIQFTTMNDTLTIEKIEVSPEKIHNGDEVYYGNLGQDLTKQYKSMTINFRQAYIKFNK